MLIIHALSIAQLSEFSNQNQIQNDNPFNFIFKFGIEFN